MAEERIRTLNHFATFLFSDAYWALSSDYRRELGAGWPAWPACVRSSDLVADLRSSEARRYAEPDTPIFTAGYQPAEETLALWH